MLQQVGRACACGVTVCGWVQLCFTGSISGLSECVSLVVPDLGLVHDCTCIAGVWLDRLGLCCQPLVVYICRVCLAAGLFSVCSCVFLACACFPPAAWLVLPSLTYSCCVLGCGFCLKTHLKHTLRGVLHIAHIKQLAIAKHKLLHVLMTSWAPVGSNSWPTGCQFFSFHPAACCSCLPDGFWLSHDCFAVCSKPSTRSGPALGTHTAVFFFHTLVPARPTWRHLQWP